MADMLARTLQTYRTAEGAQAYLSKEAKLAPLRNTNAQGLMDGESWQGKRVIDMGCGFGRDVAEMRKRGAEAFGIDGSEALLAEAQKRYGGDWWHRENILDLAESPVGSVDTIWSYALLVHIPRSQLPVVLGRWAAWLNPRGRMILASKAGSGEEVYENMGAHLPRLMVKYSIEEVVLVLEKLGLRVDGTAMLEKRSVGDDFFMIKAEKI